ncbi:hypothetical protein ACFXJO_05630 [Streptomyces lavendulae]|uniref:hypothetical protein n=1 Tax=Streptomyces lavendulae TaxID=1914 RepID=UPI00367C3CD2
MAEQQHSIVDQPATPAACSQDYEQHQRQAAVLAGAQRDQLGSATGASPHTNR